MACGCSKKKKYLVTKGDGSKETVDTLTAAMGLVRKSGGRYQQIRV